VFVFVPPPPPPSREAQELGVKIVELVRILRSDNPAIRPIDIRQGLRLAEAGLRSEIGGANVGVAIFAGLLVASLLAGIAAYFVATGTPVPPKTIVIAVAILGLGVAAVAVIVARKRG